MLLFIIILCVVCYFGGILSASDEVDSFLGFLSTLVMCSIVVVVMGLFCGDKYVKSVHRHGDNVVYRDTQYGKVDTILYIINKDTVYYDEVD